MSEECHESSSLKHLYPPVFTRTAILVTAAAITRTVPFPQAVHMLFGTRCSNELRWINTC